MTETTTREMMGALRRAINQPFYPLEVMMVCAHWYANDPLSFRHLQKMMQERGVFVDHSTVHRWAQKIPGEPARVRLAASLRGQPSCT